MEQQPPRRGREATASIMRAFIEHGMHVQQPVQRFYTMGPMFR